MRWHNKEVLWIPVRRELKGDEDGMEVWSLLCFHWLMLPSIIVHPTGIRNWIWHRVHLQLWLLLYYGCRWVAAGLGHSSIPQSQWSTRPPQVPAIQWVLFLQSKTNGKMHQTISRTDKQYYMLTISWHWLTRIPWKVKEGSKTWFQNCILSMVQSPCALG